MNRVLVRRMQNIDEPLGTSKQHLQGLLGVLDLDEL
jgi:hypothetical protein